MRFANLCILFIYVLHSVPTLLELGLLMDLMKFGAKTSCRITTDQECVQFPVAGCLNLIRWEVFCCQQAANI